MNRIKSLLLIFVLLCTISFSVITVSAEEPEYTKTFGWTQMTTPGMQEAYRIVYNSIKNFNLYKIKIPKELGLTEEQVDIIGKTVEIDFPEAFYLSPSFRKTNEIDGYTISFYVIYEANGEGPVKTTEMNPSMPNYNEILSKINLEIATFENKVSQIIARAPKESSFQDLSAYVYNYLKVNVAYEEGKNWTFDQTAYSALINGKCVCAGFAKAYATLMNRLGIPTWTITGTAVNGAGSGLHMWNVSWYNGVCVYTDPTWNSDSHHYKYLNTSGKLMAKDHFMDNKYKSVLTDCDHYQYAYNYQPPAIKANAIQLSTTNITLTNTGQTAQIQANILPENAADKSVKFSSSNASVVTVSGSGVVTAVGEGTATITVTSGDGAASAAIAVTVDLPEHVHAYQNVSETPATCNENGIKAHYRCDCGALSLDATGANTVAATDLIITAQGHEGKVLYNDVEHWTVCEICKAELSDKQEHDMGEYATCGTCGYEAAVATEPTETRPVESIPENSSEPTEAPQKPTDATTGNNNTEPSQSTSETNSVPTSPTNDFADTNRADTNKKYLYIAGTALIVLALIVSYMILKKKK